MMGGAEFVRWMAYYRIEPFGEQRADLRAALGHALLYNINRGRKDEALEAADFMPFIDQTVRARDKAKRQSKKLREALTNYARRSNPKPDR